MQSKGHFINHQWYSGQGRPFESVNPCDDTPIWRGNAATQTEVSQAFQAAKAALPAWRQLSLNERSRYLHAFVKALQARQAEMSYHLSLETGKPLWESEQEVLTLINKVKLSFEAHQARVREETIALADHTLHIRYKPLGVVAVLGPFNFPIHLSHGHLIPALLAGNTALYKPSELTPAINELIFECWEKSGLPAGVINLIQGDAQTAQLLIQMPIQAIYFTGSYHSGQQIHNQLHDRPEVLLALEMGGNNPLIVEHVHSMETALYYILASAFVTAGQRCSCARRLLIPQTSWGDQLLERLAHSIQYIQIGKPESHPTPFMGPVIRRTHALAHLAKQEQLIQLGAHPLQRMALQAAEGAFLSPGLLTLTPDLDVPDEEIFAPLLQIYRYECFEEAVVLANQTKYGLVAGLLSEQPTHYDYFLQNIQCGVVSWNKPTVGASSQLPFGGIGQSGNHRPTAYFAADHCVYPVASSEQTRLVIPKIKMPGLML